ncbi:helix-turn-helix domain-containing protein [Dactylosporangium sp. NPDC005555]|uniref:helix-turn-helix domain-containing protein n=1 Tax=Dactylosporangium sp. NPDC005555 TaxID=3154889 RepID=UPI0033A96507
MTPFPPAHTRQGTHDQEHFNSMDHPKLQLAVEDLVRAVGGHVDAEHQTFLAIIVPLSGRSVQSQPARVNVVDASPAAPADEGGRPDLLTVQETAAVLRCSSVHVKRLVAARTLPSVTIGRLRRVRRGDLDSYIRDLT